MLDPETVPLTDLTRQRLKDLRQALLSLHRVLMERESYAYQQQHGPVTRGQLLHLLLNDPWFAWLRPVSKLVADIDEMLHTDDPVTQHQGEDMIQRTRDLIAPDETGTGFGKHYFDAIQADPDVILEHRKVVKLYDERKP